MPQASFAQPPPQQPPPLEQQKAFWDGWNAEWRSKPQRDSFQQRQFEFAHEVLQSIGRRDLRILDVGCGTGWLGDSLREFGTVTGVDLSEAAIANGRKLHPDVSLLAGEFLAAPLEGKFDFVVQADSLANMPQQEAVLERIASLLNPRGWYLLMTPNYPIWKRRSQFKPIGTGQVRSMLGLRQLQAWLKPSFEVERVSSIDPGGDKGVLFWVENRWVRGGMGRLIGRNRWRSLLERARLGRELCIESRRR